MTDQQVNMDLFDPPIVRRSDPDTSHQAAARQNLGPRAVRQRQILDLVRRYPRLTSGEYARRFVAENPTMPIAVAADTPNKRLSDLLRKGLINRVKKRKCSDSGYECWTYEVTSLGLAEFDA